VLLAEGAEVVFLGVVEVWFEGDAGVRFFLGDGGGAEVEAVIFAAELDEDPFWEGGGEGEGFEEVGEEEF
jgi:hypothetical protein